MNSKRRGHLDDDTARQVGDWHEAWLKLMGMAWDHALAIGYWIHEAQERGALLKSMNGPKRPCDLSTHEVLAFRNLAQANQLLEAIDVLASEMDPALAAEYRKAVEEDRRYLDGSFRRWAETDGVETEAMIQYCRAILNRASATPADLAEAARLARRALNRARAIVTG